ncbi:MAG: hypothetical protein GW903_05940 [Alphaproteobacteria bacterium]|nr:hypothetical protein [Alphaproteobacteria bacterium]NCQ88421.1 hypothetical protein [Alphaproteobacteria bacterium]NCT05963.1 hypothetical protein [Alphaproteobacteria bacterium]
MMSVNRKIHTVIKTVFVILALTAGFSAMKPSIAFAVHCCSEGRCGCSRCCGHIGKCSSLCTCTSTNETGKPSNPSTTLGHITKKFSDHRTWLVDVILKDSAPGNPEGLFAAMQLMTNQLTVIGMQQVQAIGMFFDAKHQLETQRIFQVMTAQAHRKYQISEALCLVGTNTRGLAASSRLSDLATATIAKRSVDRLLLNGDLISTDGPLSDKASRLADYILKYCNPKDNGGNLKSLCMKGDSLRDPLDMNRDIDYAGTLASPLTLDIDFSSTDPDNPSKDEEAVFALMSNLIGHEVNQPISEPNLVTDDNTQIYSQGYLALMDSRALAAKKSVAINALASAAGIKAKGPEGVDPYMYAIIEQLGTSLTPAQIEEMLGRNMSYHARMEVLTKIANQDVDSITSLMENPDNVARRDVALLALELIQKSDTRRIFNRTEMTAAMMLETALMREQERLTGIIKPTTGSNRSGAF